MEVRRELIDNMLILTPVGRLDGFGSGQLQEALNSGWTDTVRYVIFDLTGVPYMSSAGMRVLVIAHKKVKEKSGTIYLCNLAPFVESALKMAGMLRIFHICPDVEQAFAFVREGEMGGAEKPDSTTYELEEGGTLEFTQTGTEEAILHLSGSLRRVLHATVHPDEVYQIRFSDCAYSIGLGALAEDPGAARQLLGEMITLHGSIVWLPTDGNEVPDFFIPLSDTGEVLIYTGFNAALQGPFHDEISLQSQTADGIPLSRLYQEIFRHARTKRQDYSGIVALALIGETGGIRSSGIRHSPIPENGDLNGGWIMDQDHIKEWVRVSDSLEHAGEVVVAFGIGVDLTHDLSRFNPDDLTALYYVHPANLGIQEMALHTHGVVFRNTSLKEDEDIGEVIKDILNTGEFLDMSHLMDDTRLRIVRAAVAYISVIRHGES